MPMNYTDLFHKDTLKCRSIDEEVFCAQSVARVDGDIMRLEKTIHRLEILHNEGEIDKQGLCRLRESRVRLVALTLERYLLSYCLATHLNHSESYVYCIGFSSDQGYFLNASRYIGYIKIPSRFGVKPWMGNI